jgi:hypothetical protein
VAGGDVHAIPYFRGTTYSETFLLTAPTVTADGDLRSGVWGVLPILLYSQHPLTGIKFVGIVLVHKVWCRIHRTKISRTAEAQDVCSKEPS